MKRINNSNIIILGFTLAEVLITLGIIGIVAEITIPTLYSGFVDQTERTLYKKAFSIASQAWASAVADYKIEPRSIWADDQSRNDNFNAFKSYFKVVIDCNNSNSADCWASGELSFGGCPHLDALAFTDASGMSWSETCSSGCGAEILVDTNGFKGPNKYGQDRFIFVTVLADNTRIGLPIRMSPYLNTTHPVQDYNYDASICPSGATHPCYYQSWLYN